jgi:hypothetical protein
MTNESSKQGRKFDSPAAFHRGYRRLRGTATVGYVWGREYIDSHADIAAKTM